MRVGLGYDLHNFIIDKKLILGAAEIPFYMGLEGFSDADVLIHAVCDALLGALGEGDIGEHFPDTDPKYRNIESKKLLKQVLKMIDDQQYKIVNIDTLILAEEPKLTPFKDKIKESMISILKLKPDQLNIKASTSEGKGPIGRKESIAAYAVALIDKK